MKMDKKSIVFGPVPSRRLGLSLGVDLVPYKACTFNCLYCQIGSAESSDLVRKSYYSKEQAISELKEVLSSGVDIDCITFSGSGEPTLSSDIGILIDEFKKLTDIPIAVLTNGSLLYLEDVQKDLKNADILIPSLDAVDREIFEKINRPHPNMKLDNILEGIKNIRKWFRGEVRLEIMLVKGLNDTDTHIKQLAELANHIGADKIELNTVVRPPAEMDAKPLSEDEIARISGFFGGVGQVITPFTKSSNNNIMDEKLKEQKGLLLNTISRRPLTLKELAELTGVKEEAVLDFISIVGAKYGIKRKTVNDILYFYI